jgi:hypothetical protein
MEIAPLQKSLTAAGGGVQETHCTVVTKQLLSDPHPGVFQCAYNVPLKVLLTVSGDVPNPTTGPADDPLRMVIVPFGTVEVNFKTCPATAPKIGENSPA